MRYNKVFTCFLVLVSFTFFISSCSNESVQESAVASNNVLGNDISAVVTTSNIEQEQTVNMSEEHTNELCIPEEYINLLDVYYYYLASDLSYNDFFSEFSDEESFPFIYYALKIEFSDYDNDDFLSTKGFTLIDVDGNGVEELLILNLPNSYSTNEIVISMYTLVDNLPYSVLTSGARARHYLLGNCYFRLEGSSGATYTIYELLEYSDNIECLSFVESYYSDIEGDLSYDDYVIGWYYTTDRDTIINGNTNEAQLVTYEMDELEIVANDWLSDTTYDFGDAIYTFADYIPHYEFVIEDCTVEEAQSRCEEMGGHLLTINSLEEMRYINEITRVQGLEHNIFMVGATYEENAFIWSCDGENENVVNELWMENEPSYTGATEDGRIIEELYTAIMYDQSINSYVMMDVPNDLIDAAPSYSGNIGYICEYD